MTETQKTVEDMRWPRASCVITRLVCAYPLTLIAYYYATWCAGYLMLGYWPRSSQDDPARIGGNLFDSFYIVTMLLILCQPMFCFAAASFALALLVWRPKKWLWRELELAIAIVLFFGAYWFQRWDPNSVVEWFWD